jgi:hypothetical protein
MDPAQILIAVIGTVISIVTFYLMRYPHMRREPFNGFGAFSVGASAAGALAVLLFVMLLVLAQGAWQKVSGQTRAWPDSSGHRVVVVPASAGVTIAALETVRRRCC